MKSFRTFCLGILTSIFLVLTGCGGGGSSSTPADADTSITMTQVTTAINSAVTSATQAEDAKIAAVDAKVQQLQLVGYAGGITYATASDGTHYLMSTSATAANPCTNMGTDLGPALGVDPTDTNAQSSNWEIYKSCKGTIYTVSLVTGLIGPAYIFFTQPNCGGNGYAPTDPTVISTTIGESAITAGTVVATGSGRNPTQLLWLPPTGSSYAVEITMAPVSRLVTDNTGKQSCITLNNAPVMTLRQFINNNVGFSGVQDAAYARPIINAAAQ